MRLKASMTLLSALASLCLGCAPAPGSSPGLSSAPASSASPPSSQSSSQRALAPGYFRDGEGHWREYEGDATHERVSYAPHEFGEWKESGGVLQRECTVCGYAEAHEHTFPEGYEHDEYAHWREADCGHSAREDYGPHEWALSYDVENDAIIRVNTCAVCGYQTRESTYDPAFAGSITFVEAADGGLEVNAIGDYKDAPVLNYPRSYEGRPVTSIYIRLRGVMNSMATNDSKAVVFVPSSVKNIYGYLVDKTEVDLFYDGTMKDWLSIKTNSIAKSRINLHLKDESGSYYRLKDVTLPAGTKSLRSQAFSFLTIESFRCNEELEKIDFWCFFCCRYLKHVSLNDGLLEISLSAFDESAIESLRIPSSVQKVAGRVKAFDLYEVVVEEGVTPDIGQGAFSPSPRLVRLLDYRKERSEELAHTQPLVATAEDPDRVKIHRDQGYVLMETASGFSLLGYRGGETCISVPSSFQVDGKIVDSYMANGHFLDGEHISLGGIEISDEVYRNYSFYDNVFEMTFTESLTSCEKDTFFLVKTFPSFRRAYFRMGKEAMLERIKEDVDTWMIPEYSQYPYLPEFFYMENGEYVCLNPRGW